MYTQLIPIIVPVLICALLGYGWARSGLPFAREFLTRIIMNIGAPCLILNGIVNLEFSPVEFATILGTSVTVLVTCSLIGAAALRLAGQPLRSFLPPVIFGNTGNLGLPLCLFAFGDEGLGLAVAVYLVYAVSQFVFGPLVQGREPAWRTLVATDTPMPETLANTVGLLGGLAIPLMLLALGYSLASFRVTRPGKAAGLAIFRRLLGFAVGVGVAELFGLTGTMRGVVIIESYDAAGRVQLPAGGPLRPSSGRYCRCDPDLDAVVVPDDACVVVVCFVKKVLFYSTSRPLIRSSSFGGGCSGPMRPVLRRLM